MLNAPPISPVTVSTVPNAIHDVFLRPCLALFPSNSLSPLSHSFSHPPLVPFSPPSRSTPSPRAHVLFVAPALERVCAPHPVRKRSPRRRRTVRIPISLPASLSPCGIRVQRLIQCTRSTCARELVLYLLSLFLPIVMTDRSSHSRSNEIHLRPTIEIWEISSSSSSFSSGITWQVWDKFIHVGNESPNRQRIHANSLTWHGSILVH